MKSIWCRLFHIHYWQVSKYTGEKYPKHVIECTKCGCEIRIKKEM